MINLMQCLSIKVKSKSIYEFCNMGTLYSWQLDFLCSNPIIIIIISFCDCQLSEDFAPS
jgi:hypothetical protein